jgi:hypothetical protein
MIHLLAATAIHLAGDYQPKPAPHAVVASVTCGPGTVAVSDSTGNSTCVAANASPVVGTISGGVIVSPLPYGYGRGWVGPFRFHH